MAMSLSSLDMWEMLGHLDIVIDVSKLEINAWVWFFHMSMKCAKCMYFFWDFFYFFIFMNLMHV